MTVQEHPNGEEFRPVRAASEALDAHLTLAIAELSQEKPAVTSSFAASIKTMMDEARAGVQKAREDGLVQIQGAVAKLEQAKTATSHVAGSMAKTIEDEANSVLAELGQISNDLGV